MDEKEITNGNKNEQKHYFLGTVVSFDWSVCFIPLRINSKSEF